MTPPIPWRGGEGGDRNHSSRHHIYIYIYTNMYWRHAKVDASAGVQTRGRVSSARPHAVSRDIVWTVKHARPCLHKILLKRPRRLSDPTPD